MDTLIKTICAVLGLCFVVWHCYAHKNNDRYFKLMSRAFVVVFLFFGFIPLLQGLPFTYENIITGLFVGSGACLMAILIFNVYSLIL